MRTISFVVLGDPKAQKRHRTYTKGKGGKALPFPRQVDPSADDKSTFIAQALQWAPESPLDGPLSLNVHFFFPRPRSHYGTGRNAEKLKPSAPQHHTKKPDTDNCVKLVKDAMNGIFYRDDCQIVSLMAFKHYAETQPRTDITISRVPLDDTE